MGFEENRKFLSLSGVIGRRDFIINILWIELVECLLYTTVLGYMVLLSPDILAQFKIGAPLPQWHNIWVACVGAISAVLYYPSIVRRVRDIFGADNENNLNIISVLLIFLVFQSYLPIFSFVKGIPFFVFVVLACMQGKITGMKPKNDVIKFNWGAFLGTWIWGVFNKSWITLLAIPLFFTAGYFPFAIICGLKGNEWAYKNKRYENIEQFHKSQSNQATIWACFTPIIAIVGSFLLTIGFIFMLGVIVKANPDYITHLENKLVKLERTFAETNFDKIELTDDEYKFYINPKVWVGFSKKQKSTLFQSAVAYVYAELKIEKPKDKEALFEQSSTLSKKVKIYSSFNNELLGEYQLNSQDVQEALKNIGQAGGYKKYSTLLQNAYSFNEYPSLP